MANYTGTSSANNYMGDNTDQVIDGGDGYDTLNGAGGNDTIIGGFGNDSLTGGSGNDVFLYNARQFGNDTITDFVQGQDKIDLSNLFVADLATLQPFLSQSGLDTIVVLKYGSYTESITIKGIVPGALTAADFIFNTVSTNLTVSATGSSDVIFGGNGNDSLYGGDGYDTLSAGTGNDYLDGGDGNDSLSGGDGNDVFAFTNRQFGDDTISDFVQGQDKIDLSILHIADLASLQPFMLQSGLDTVIALKYGSYSESITIKGIVPGALTADDFVFNTLTTNLTVNATGSSDVIFGGNGNDSLFGGDGYDTLSGGAGNDYLDAGFGNDSLTGGDGNDVFAFTARQFGNDIIVDFVQGQDKIDLSILHAGDLASLQPFMTQSGLDTVISIQYGSYSESITIKGIVPTALTAADFIFNTASTGLTVTATGSSDVIFGGNGNDSLYGGDGYDTLAGGAGNDYLDAGPGNDSLIGGAGNDIFAFTTRQFGNDTITDFKQGQDKVDLSFLHVADLATLQPFMSQSGDGTVIALSYGSNSESVTIKGILPGALTASDFIFNTATTALTVNATSSSDVIFGGSGNDSLFGGDGYDTLAGGAGNDYLDAGPGNDGLIGGAGNDIFAFTARQFGNDTITDFTQGQDKIDLSVLHVADLTTLQPFMSQSGNGTVITLQYGSYSESITIKGMLPTNFTASDFIFNTSSTGLNFTATGSSDIIFGGNGNDTLYGGNSSDTLSGGAGADSMFGGSSSDMYFVDNAGDVVSEQTTPGTDDGGTDTVVSSVNFILPAFVENLILSGTGLTGIGNSLNNSMAVSGGGDSLYGMEGNDYLVAGPGYNLLDGGTGTNTAIFNMTRAQAYVTLDGNGRYHIGNGTQDNTVVNIQYLQFSDGSITTPSMTWAPTVINNYQAFFARGPSVTELSYWTNALSSGTKASDFIKTLANDPTGKANEAALIKLLYNGYFGRDPSSSEVGVWTNALQSGAATVATFNTILANDAGGKAYLPVSIKALYDTYVGRDPSAAEVTFWKGALQSGTYDLRQMQLVLAAQPGAQAHETAYLTQAYQTWLGTNPSVSDISYWSGQLNNAAVLPSQIRSILINDAGGQAHIAAIVSAEYSAYFGRAASTAEINVWKGLIAGGADFTTLQSALLSDAAGATAKTITSYYDSYFGRDPSFNEIGVWRGLLANGATTTTLRSALLGDAAGQAHTTAEVTSQYQTYFGRDPSQGEINTWKGLINGGATFTTLHNALVGDGGGKAHAAAEITPLYQADFGRAPAAGETAYWTNAFNTGTANLDSFIDTLLTNAGSVIATVQATPGHAATTWIDIGDPLVINGFTAADHIAFSGPAFTGYNALDHAVQTGNDVLIYASDPTHVVLLENVHLTDLTAANFIDI